MTINFKANMIITLLFVLWPASAYLEVYIPQCARAIIPDNIQYTLSNFGSIPYGETYIGNIHVAKNQELCDVTDQESVVGNKDSTKSIFLIRRGTCKFTSKVLNAQKLGAKLVIVYDNQTTFQPGVIMKNDGHGHLINIPSVFISNSDGLKILKSIKQCNGDLIMRIFFQVFQTQTANLSLWLTPNNRQSYVLLRDFYTNDYYQVIKQYVNLEVKFHVDKGCKTNFCQTNDCIGSLKNLYCLNVGASDDMFVKVTPGNTILNQSLRMFYLYSYLPKTQKQTWWKYMIKFDDQVCLEKKDIEDCSYTVMKAVGVSDSISKSIKNKINEQLKVISNDTDEYVDSVFKDIRFQARELNVLFYPEATINSKNFYGLFKAPDVFEMLCNSLISQPKECYTFIKNKEVPKIKDESQDLWLTILFIVLLMIAGFIVALMVYTRLIKRQVNQQMSMQVNKMVQNYVNLTQQKSVSNMSSGKYDKLNV